MQELDVREILCSAVTQLIDQRLSELNFDKTILCTVREIVDEDAGIYKVTDGATIFEACAAADTYTIDDQVYVTIPLGDMSAEQKLIIGRYISANNKPIAYLSAEEGITQARNICNLKTKSKIAINQSKDTLRQIREVDVSGFTTQYNAVLLTADFTTDFTPNVRFGNYGLVAAFYDANDKKMGSINLDSSHMVGNPYWFAETEFNQGRTYKINFTRNIRKIKIFLYQNNNFAFSKGAQMEPTGEITVSNIRIELGYSVAAGANDSVMLVTGDPEVYLETDNSRTIELVYFNKDKDGRMIGFSDGTFDKKAFDAEEYGQKRETLSEAEAYLSTVDTMGTTQLEGLYAENNLLNGFNVGNNITVAQARKDLEALIDTLSRELNTIYYGIELYRNEYNGGSWKMIDSTKTNNLIKVTCLKELDSTEFKVIIWRNGLAKESNTLKFVNGGKNK